MSALRYHVVSRADGRTVVARFLLRDDALAYAKLLEAREGPHGPGYDVKP